MLRLYTIIASVFLYSVVSFTLIRFALVEFVAGGSCGVVEMQCVGQIEEPEIPLTSVYFDYHTFDIGQVNCGAEVIGYFVVRNTGSNPLIIETVKGTCPLATDWPKIEIAPGKLGTIRLAFDTAGKEGPQALSANVKMNTKEKVALLTLMAEIIPKNARKSF